MTVTSEKKREKKERNEVEKELSTMTRWWKQLNKFTPTARRRILDYLQKRLEEQDKRGPDRELPWQNGADREEDGQD